MFNTIIMSFFIGWSLTLCTFFIHTKMVTQLEFLEISHRNTYFVIKTTSWIWIIQLIDFIHNFIHMANFTLFCVFFKYPTRIFCDYTVIFHGSRPLRQTQSTIPHPHWKLSLWSPHNIHLDKEAHDKGEERKAGFDGRSSVEERTVGALVRAAHIADVQIEVVVRCVDGRVVHT